MVKKKIGIVLGGGAARGLAHVGVLKVLLNEGIKPDLIVGTSIGALIGSIYATHPDPDEVISIIRKYFECECFSRIKFDFLKQTEDGTANDGLFDALSRYLRKTIFYNVSLAKQSFVSEFDYLENISMLIDDISIEDTQIPLGIVCTDLNTGEEVILTEGSLRTAVAASSAIPGIFPPIEYGDKLLVDGGWVNQLPAKPCMDLGADLVIAVAVARELEQDYSIDSGLDILRRANAITRSTLSTLHMKDADYIITPEVGDISWAGFECVDECLNRGEVAAVKSLPVIKAFLA